MRAQRPPPRLAGFGLEAFISASTTGAAQKYGIAHSMDLSPGPRGGILAVSIGQCSVGWCALNYLKYGLRMRVEANPDVFHRCWNDVKIGLGRAGFWEAVLLSSIWINVNFGPWKGGKFWRETQGAAEEYFEHTGSSSCRLFGAMLPFIAKDRGESAMLGDMEYGNKIFDMFKGGLGWSTKGPKVALCRWFGWLHCIRFWLPLMSLRLVVLMYWGISMGYVNGTAQSMSLELRGLNRQPAANRSQKATMQQAQASTKQLYDKAKNTLHIATVLMPDRGLCRMVRVAHRMCTPIEQWYHQARVVMRSVDGSLQFHKEQSHGACLLPLLGTFNMLQDLGALQDMGFCTSVADMPLASLSSSLVGTMDTDEASEEEDGWMRRCFELSFELVRARLRSVLAYMEYFPFALAAFIGTDSRECAMALGRMGDVYGAWLAASEIELPHVQAMVGRSVMVGEVARLAFNEAFEEKRVDIEAFLEGLASAIFGIGHTAVIEDAFQRLRLRETRSASHSVFSPRSVWSTTVQKQILSKLYNFPTIGYQAASATHVEAGQAPLPPSVYAPGKCKPSVPLRSVMGKSSSVPWTSMRPQSSHVQLADVAAWRCCVEEGQDSWGKLGRVWFNRLMLVGLLVRRRGARGKVAGEWWWSLGAVESEAVLMWRNSAYEHGGQGVPPPRLGEEVGQGLLHVDGGLRPLGLGGFAGDLLGPTAVVPGGVAS